MEDNESSGNKFKLSIESDRDSVSNPTEVIDRWGLQVYIKGIYMRLDSQSPNSVLETG